MSSFGKIVEPLTDWIYIDTASARPNTSVPITAPLGFQLPRKQIAKAIQPRPPIQVDVYAIDRVGNNILLRVCYDVFRVVKGIITNQRAEQHDWYNPDYKQLLFKG